MTVNYHNIVVARESRGLTQSELTKAIKGLSQGNLSRMEKGLLPISEEILNAISKKLDYPLSFFSKATIRIPLGTFHYRCLLSTSPSPRDRTRSRMPSSA